MVSAFDALEADFFGDLATDTHGLWEVFEFVRLHFPAASDAEVLATGRDYITRWISAGWIRIAAVPLYPSSIITFEAVAAFLEEKGPAATRYLENSPSLD